MSDASESGRQSRRREITRQRLLAAALVVFERDGLENATIASITEEADVGFGTFYLYFESKRELFESVVREGLGELAALLADAIQQAEDRGDDLRELVERFVTTYYQFASEHRSMYRIMIAGRESGIGLARGLQEPFASRLTRWIRIAERQGRVFAGYTPEIAAVALVAALNRTGVWWMHQQDVASATAPSLDEVIETMNPLILAILEGPRGEK